MPHLTIRNPQPSIRGSFVQVGRGLSGLYDEALPYDESSSYDGIVSYDATMPSLTIRSS